MKIIGLDVGEKRIGVAKVDSSVRIAIPVGFVITDGSEWQEIARIASLNSTNFFVLGLPRSNEGNETAQSQYVKKFAAELIKNIPGAKVQFQDESLTSVLAEERLKSRKKPYQKGDIDAEAAAIILQDFVERKSSPGDHCAEPSKSGRVKIAVAFAIAAVLGVVGVTVALKVRDYIREQRAEEYAKQEAEMKAEVFNFTVRPGETIFDVKNNLAKMGYSSEEIDVAFAAKYDFDFLPEGASLEGYLFPETHEFYADTKVEEIIRRFLEGMEQVITDNDLVAKYATHGLTLHQGITLASVVQKEAGSLANQAIVAQVFYSRLNYGWKMGSDVTVSYALDVIDPERTVYTDNAAALTVDSCYNTRIYTGLPCGPISNPGLSALLATAEPSDTAYLYFLTGDDGLMYYSYTEAEHIQNIYLHCKELCNVSL